MDAIDFMINEEGVKKSTTMFNDKTQQIANQRQTQQEMFMYSTTNSECESKYRIYDVPKPYVPYNP